jgi:hypothetical protein
MRHLIRIAAVCCGLHAIVSAQALGTASELADDALGGALWRIAVATHTRIGFESIEFVNLSLLKKVPAFPVSSRDEALKTAVDANSRYEWTKSTARPTFSKVGFANAIAGRDGGAVLD